MSLSFVVALRGVVSQKKVDGKRTNVVPFVGANGEGQWPKVEMGIGLLHPDGSEVIHFFGVADSHLVIQSWRAMKILERVKDIGPDTLAACWYAAQPSETKNGKPLVDDLARVVGEEKLEAIRQKVHLSAPSTAVELPALLRGFDYNFVPVSYEELEQEIKAGRIKKTTEVSRIIVQEKCRTSKKRSSVK